MLKKKKLTTNNFFLRFFFKKKKNLLFHLSLWVERWFFFGFCAGIIALLLSILICDGLNFPSFQIFFKCFDSGFEINLFFFQNPDCGFMERIINLHHEIMFYLIILSVLVFWFLVRINFFFINTSNVIIKEPSKVTHNTTLEIILTIIPCILLFLIAIPSLTLIYSFQPLISSNIVLVENFFLGFQGQEKINCLGLDNNFSEIRNCKTMFKTSSGSVNKVVGNLVRQPRAQIIASYGNNELAKYSDWSLTKQSLYNDMYVDHPKKLIAIYKDFTVATLGCTTIPKYPFFGSICDFFYDGLRPDGKATYSSPGLFFWKTGTVVYEHFYSGVYPVNPRSINEQLFLEALENIQNPSWEDLVLEAENHQQLVFEVEDILKDPE